MRNVKILLASLLLMLPVSCSQPNKGKNPLPPGTCYGLDGTHRAAIDAKWVFANGEEESNAWTDLIVIDQRGASLNFWGILAVCQETMNPGNSHFTFDSEQSFYLWDEGPSAPYYTMFFSGEGNNHQTNLKIKVITYTFTGTELNNFTVTYKITLLSKAYE